MTITDLPSEEMGDQPVRPTPSRSRGDQVFRGVTLAAATATAIIVVITVVSLVRESRVALRRSGIIHFFTSPTWNTHTDKLGVLSVLGGTIIIAGIALIIAAPAGVATALFINEYAPARLRRVFTSGIDLLAAVPSIIYGLWGLYAVRDQHLLPIERWLQHNLSVIPVFQLKSNEHVSAYSSLVAGVIVGFMILPIITALSREVMSQVPRDQCEAALALGGTRWGMVRDVILPFSRSGIVSSWVLGLGRALGETIAVSLLIAFAYKANPHILTSPASSIPAMIVNSFGQGTNVEQSGLVAAGFALFILTLLVNFASKGIVARANKVR